MFKLLSTFLFALIVPLLLPLGVALYYEYIQDLESTASYAFLLTILAIGLLALFFRFLAKVKKQELYRRQALLTVISIYILTSVLGGLPFLFSGTFKNPIDAFFEAVSGLTTTGATVMEEKKYDASGAEIPIVTTFVTGASKTYSFYGTITPVVRNGKTFQGVEAVSPALLLWRSQMQWLGGGGIVVLFLTLLPLLGMGGKVLYQAETTGPTKESIVPRVKDTASKLWRIYVGLTVLETALLLITNRQMPVLDALTISFSTLSTGGFSPKNQSIAAYNNPWTDWVVIVFMLLGSISFSIYIHMAQGKLRKLNDSELKLFLSIVLFTSLFSTWNLFIVGYPATDALRYGTFQVVSAQTSTGFATANYDIWPFPIQTVMLIAMYLGGMAGSTAGGMKVVRVQIIFRMLIDKIESIFRPDSVRIHRVGKKIIDEGVGTAVLTFFAVLATFAVVGTFLLVCDGVDPETSLTTMACMLNNVGLGSRMGGPTHSFAFLSDFGKLFSAFAMLAGRLEFFALFVMFLPSFWRKI